MSSSGSGEATRRALRLDRRRRRGGQGWRAPALAQALDEEVEQRRRQLALGPPRQEQRRALAAEDGDLVGIAAESDVAPRDVVGDQEVGALGGQLGARDIAFGSD